LSTKGPQGLKRDVGIGVAATVTIGLIIGSGIFRVPATVAAQLGSVSAILVVWVVGGLVTLCLAICLAELATAFPSAGGLYVYLREAYGPALAFVFGWTFLLVNPAMWAAIALIFAEYLGQFMPLSPMAQRFVASGLILTVSAVNFRSVRLAGLVQGIATSAKVLALAAVAGVLLLAGSRAHGSLVAGVTATGVSSKEVVFAVVAVLWSYEGVAAACALAGEVRNPGRTLPRALILGVLAVVALYLLINLAYLYVLPMSVLGASPFVAADAMRAVAGESGAAAIAACVVVSTFGALASTALVDPRVFYAMACDRLFFAAIGKAHPRFQTPHRAVVISAALGCGYVWIRSFEELAAQFVLGMWPFYALAVFGAMRLRRTRPQLERPYRVLGYPLTPVIFLVAALLLIGCSLIELPGVTLLNFAVAAIGFPVYWLWQRPAKAGRALDSGRA